MAKINIGLYQDIEQVLSSNLPFVVYKKPNENLAKLQVQISDVLNELKSFQESGFLFSPFKQNEKSVIFPFNASKISSYELSDEPNNSPASSTIDIINFSNKEQHIELVNKGIEFINSSDAQKVVLSRQERIEACDLNILETLKVMFSNYKNAFVYCWFHPKVGLWMGASPEQLIDLKSRKFKTMALAGTQAFDGSLDVKWKQKEQDEQQYVTDYILNNIINQIEVKEVEGPYTVKAGSLLHIRTDISGNLISEGELEQLITKIHPTPAVCGLPKEDALEFIDANEGYNRSYYAGYLGELNYDKSTKLFVNLRCMKVESNACTLYVGGGITERSDALKEWEETNAKAKVLGSVLIKK